MKSGVSIRVAVMTGIYHRVLRLSPVGRRGLTTGNITNLFALDAMKLYEVTAEGHLLWSAPLSMVLVGILLIVIVGPSMAVGIVLLLAFTPMVQVISNRMMEIRQQRIKVTDKRVEIVNAMLSGIKVTKLNNYEERYFQQITAVREEELQLLRKELYVWSMVMAVQFISPVVASIGAFAAYVFVGNVLTTADAFTALLLFNALRFPINYASRLIGKMAQARESARRIKEFMEREVLEEDNSGGGGGGSGESCSQRDGGSGVDGNGIQDENNEKRRTSQSCNGNTSLNNIQENDSMREYLPTSIEEKSLHEIDDKSTDHSNSHAKSTNLLTITNGIFQIGRNTSSTESSDDTSSSTVDESGFIVKGINISLNAGEILAIVGPVGGGKTTIINAIIGEVAISPKSTITSQGRVAYASQVPFILNATIRDNILFGNDYDPDRYDRVLDDCCLRSDIDQLAAGDLTEIGERGVTLSGGQKQRVSLARVVYSNPDIALFDDPLSALDAGTNRRVFDRLFKQSGNKLLANAAVILVTHASHFLHRVDQIMVVVDGGVSFSGSWSELSKFKADDPKSKLAIESIQNAVQEDGDDVQEEKAKIAPSSNHSVLTNTEMLSSYKRRANNMHQNVTEALMSRESRQHGKTRLWTWTLWFREAGGLVFTTGVLTVFALEKLFYFGTEWWMARWTQAAYEPITFLGIEFPSQSDGVHAQHGYLIVYAIFMVLGFICAFLRTVWIVSGGVKCSRNLYSSMTSSVLHAPMFYFETTPMVSDVSHHICSTPRNLAFLTLPLFVITQGRLLNRFTYDAEILDITLVWSMSMLLISFSWFLTGIIVMISILPWMILALIPVSACYWVIQKHYRKTGADLQRIDALSRSPLQAMLAEGIEGSATIRSFQKEETFTHRFHGFVDQNISAQLNFISAQRWLGVRIELLGASVVFVATLLVITFNEVFGLSAGFVALLIRWSSSLTISLSFFMDNAAETEGAITAIERIKMMSEETPQEQNFERKLELSDDSWPSKGELEFRDVQMRYRPLLPPALDGLSFRVEAGQHCGVVGRTGAGKSSITVSMFRLVDIDAGAIMVDGVDISTLGLSDVRGRPNGIAIIPQDPVLFAGTMRECLDPFNACADEQLLDALLSVRMLGPGKGKEFLDTRVEEGGANYSVGERSLLVLARAMLAKPKLLVMDEATGK